MRILIVEEALRLGNGHWPRYIADLAEGFRAAGDCVDVLGHKEVNQKVRTVVHGVVPWLSRDCRVDRRSQGLIGGIRHNLCLKSELKAWLKEREPYDWILSLSSRPKHLLAFAILASAKRYSQTRFLLLFVLSPGQRDIAGNFRLSASNLFAKFCFALLRSAVQRGQAVIAAETEGMQEEIERFSGLPVKLFPHPVVMPEAAESPMAYRGGLIAERPLAAGGEQIADGREDTLYAGRSALDSKAPATSYPQPATSTKPLLVVAPGLARYEKGSDFMQTAIRLLLQKAETLKSEKLKEACSAPKDRRSGAAGEFEPCSKFRYNRRQKVFRWDIFENCL